MSCDGGSLLVFSVAQKSSYSITEEMYLPDIGSSVVFFEFNIFFHSLNLLLYSISVNLWGAAMARVWRRGIAERLC